MRSFAFLVMVLLALAIAEVPLLGLPLKWVETYFHEISHGLAALATGGRIVHFELHFDGSGVCYSAGGWALIVAFAGYAGASAWGLAIYRIAGEASPKAGRTLAGVLAALIALSWVIWGRGVDTAVVVAVLVGLFVAVGFAGRIGFARQAIAFIGVSVAVSAIRAPLILLTFGGQSDARALADMTLIPRVVWVAAWAAIAVFVVYRMWRMAPRLGLFTPKAA